MPDKPLSEMNKRELEQYHKDRFKRQNEAIKQNWDRISATLPKGTKERIKETGYSVNNFINDAVIEKLERIGSKASDQDKEDLPFPE